MVQNQKSQGDFDEQTSHLGQSLQGLEFPADKHTIINYARSHQLDPLMVSTLENLPERQYQDLRDVLAHFMGGTGRVEGDDAGLTGQPG